MAKVKKRQGPGRKRQRSTAAGRLVGLIRGVRARATNALQGLRREIATTERRLEELVKEEREFLSDLSGRSSTALKQGTNGRRRSRGRPVRRGPAKADKYFAKLPPKFSLDDVRTLAGRLSGVSLAQWSRAKKVRKVADGYEKI